jgi:hypothetical protein
MTNRPAPTEASVFAAACLRPLKDFLEQLDGRVPWAVEESGFVEGVLKAVTQKFTKAVEELMDLVSAAESSLKGRKRGANKGGFSDAEKVQMQINLDVNAFWTGLVELMDGKVEQEGGLKEALDELRAQGSAGKALFDGAAAAS